MLVVVGGGLTVILAVVELNLVAEEVFVVDVDDIFVVDDDLLVEEETEVDVDEETVLEDEEPEPEPGLGNVDPMSPQRTLLWRTDTS